jgi:4-hydroxy-3-methylbut-2-en-1-yl diphosphate synthase IspG/GcpE
MLLATPTYCASRFTYLRRRTREVAIGNVIVGGDQPIRVQSMTTTRTQDVEATLAQTIRLVEVGCEIVRHYRANRTDAQPLAISAACGRWASRSHSWPTFTSRRGPSRRARR